MRPHRASQEHGGVREQKERGPEDGRTSGEMIVEMTGTGTKNGPGQAVFIEAHFAKAGVRRLVVVLEIEIVFDEGRACERVIANAIAAHPGIDQWQGEEEKHKEKTLEFPSATGPSRDQMIWSQKGNIRGTSIDARHGQEVLAFWVRLVGDVQS
jgi:hypothetical protein